MIPKGEFYLVPLSLEKYDGSSKRGTMFYL